LWVLCHFSIFDDRTETTEYMESFCRTRRVVSKYENCGNIKTTIEGQRTSENFDFVILLDSRMNGAEKSGHIERVFETEATIISQGYIVRKVSGPQK